MFSVVLGNMGEKKALFQHSCSKNVYFSVMEICIETGGQGFFLDVRFSNTHSFVLCHLKCNLPTAPPAGQHPHSRMGTCMKTGCVGRTCLG